MLVATVPAAVQFLVFEPVFALELPAAVMVVRRHHGDLQHGVAGVPPGRGAQAHWRQPLRADRRRRTGQRRADERARLDEPFTWRQAAGGLLVIAGVLLVTLSSRS